ncbi:hypothetical protein L1987_52719 [Smallanthus sonchifolius]|uniref:Uncharacterized protein n=1 Tax=Smallanthus sonchifolius TaxID=185202 RepID=A0ACB9ETC4_9ASTR|nr:hypothetical protein L1987_52719 [Smallanthus sonchifolius]
MSNPHRKYFKLVKTESSSKQPEIAIKSLQWNVKVEPTQTSNNLHVKQEPFDKKPLKLEIPSPLKLKGTVHEDLPPLDVKDVVAFQESIISEDHYPPHASFDFGPFDDNWVLNYNFPNIPLQLIQQTTCSHTLSPHQTKIPNQLIRLNPSVPLSVGLIITHGRTK